MTPTLPVPAAPISPLRRRLIEDMNMRHFAMETQRNYIRDVGRFATFLGRPPDTAIAEDVRRFQVNQQDAGVPVPTMNSIVSALRFFFTHTLDRPDLARKLVRRDQGPQRDLARFIAIVPRILASGPDRARSDLRECRLAHVLALVTRPNLRPVRALN